MSRTLFAKLLSLSVITLISTGVLTSLDLYMDLAMSIDFCACKKDVPEGTSFYSLFTSYTIHASNLTTFLVLIKTEKFP